MIAELALRKGYQVHRSSQPHGARLEREPRILERVKDYGASTVIVVEMPGPETEEAIRAMGKHLVVIDHHNYTDLERAHAPDGSTLPSSLEQFLAYAGIEEVHLRRWGYEPDLVRGIGLWDAGYIWGVMAAGYSRERALEVAAFKDELAEKVGAAEADPVNRAEAERVFQDREKFGSYFVVVSLHPTARIRSSLSRLFAFTYWKPMTVIISERAGERLYVQETDRALDLFHCFGGFTFGTDRNWGYDNETEEEKVTLGQVKEFLGGRE
ncbi:TPA: hypothetical protein DDZ10_02600 [Candidatus Uhrbacteria bacterium]|uniref:Uncharacterized protein n=1 Tax=Candidatus Uhrbacteria bacterium GW2011_GWC2_53_7 TaxID=1618986 RepID=A0A0G1XW85_9BACT|nr:MAG: hypothetical protein UY82_C0038G0016 [Candidatus Uhrbacteria bacterium GW2011_GWC2_53_7]OGL71547.1 MAG: hypothetical protein A3D69_01750 [Candidatus Uhrbacteria bacterium RIFCSPHIGHO2_02_FULL_54_11]HBL39539.1 hypothetical protein [Candidatus Uhrbacteria bacterium]